MEAWRLAFRDGFAPQLSTAGLLALRDALKRDRPELIQGCTTQPPPLACVADWPCEGACVVGYACWHGLPDPKSATVADVETAFAEACFACDRALGERAACRWFLNAADETPRAEFFPLLLGEVELALASRTPEPGPPAVA